MIFWARYVMLGFLLIHLLQATVNLANMDKKQRQFDTELAGANSRFEEKSAELESVQREARNFQTEIYKLRTSYEESVEQYDSAKREVRTLTGNK